MSEPTRREALAAAAIVAITTPGDSRPPARPDTRIKDENAKPGTTDWQLTYVKFDAKAKYRQSLVEGYCTRTSVAAGETIGLCVSTNPASPFSVDIYRLGYYGGTGARLVKSLGPFQGKEQPTPAMGEKRLRECAWEPAVTLEIPKDWVSGVYLAKIVATKHRYQSYCIFIVRDDRPADVLFQCSTNTWQAYNKWPDKY